MYKHDLQVIKGATKNIFVSATKIGKNATKILHCCFSQ